jgi:hypothetical protein
MPNGAAGAPLTLEQRLDELAAAVQRLTAGESKPDQYEQIVRGSVVVLLTLGFLYGFVWSRVVSTESFAIVLGVAVTWLFKSKDQQQQAKDTKDAVRAATTAPAPTAPAPPAGGVAP